MTYRMWYAFINNQSIKARFLTSLFVNIIKMGLSLISGIIIARNLGPASYGNYSFLLGSFVSIPTLINMGISQAFYTFISQKKQGSKFYIYYLSWIAMQFILISMLIAFIFPDTWRDKIWLGQAKGIIVLAFMASFIMNRLWQIVTQAGESIRATVIVQLYNVSIVGLYLSVVSAMVLLRCLTVSGLFISSILIYLFASFILAAQLKDNLITRDAVKLPNIIKEFRKYSSPLISYSIIGFLYSFANLWLLQRFGGSVQQGFYNVGLRFSAVCLVATTSILNVFWKEIAEANGTGNKERLYYLYTKVSRGLCFVSAMAACLLIPFSKGILVSFLGSKYEGGWFCLAIMFLYPIHQSLGQINGSYFCATAQTGLRSKIGVISMIASLPITYFVLAPSSALIPGFGLGSAGMALQIVILQIITVNVLAYFISKLSAWRFDFLYQFESIGVLLIASYAIKGLLGWVFHILSISLHPLALMAFCVPIYILAIGLIIYLFPSLSGLEKREVKNAVYLLRRGLKPFL